MSERRCEVHWVPRVPRQFVTWGPDLKLYQVVDNPPKDENDSEYQNIGNKRWAQLLGSVSEPHYIKCVDLWRGDGVVVAAGQACGKVSLVTFSQEEVDGFPTEREMQPKRNRPCSCVAWNPAKTMMLACGFEKVRNDFGVTVWDLGQGMTEKPLFEIGHPGDHCYSLAWSHSLSNLVTGMNSKFVKIFDTRNPTKPSHQTQTRAIDGLSVDPGSDYRISGYSENQVMIWDTRNFDKPIITINTQQQVVRLAWCPTRHGLLANCVRDSTTIMLRDIMSWAVTQEDGEASVTERSVLPPTGQLTNIADFAWHPSKENTLLAMGINGRFAEWTVADRLTLNWSSRHGIVWSSGGSKLQVIEPEDEQTPEGSDLVSISSEVADIGLLMQKLAKRGYNGVASVAQAEQLDLGPELKSVWAWVLHFEELHDLNVITSSTGSSKLCGMRSFLKANHTSQVVNKPWLGLDGHRSIRTYASDERELILRLCGWDDKRIVSKHPKTLEEISRSATISVFNLDMKNALEVLKAGCSNAHSQGDQELANKLSMVCVAVSGFSTDGAKLWRDMVSATVSCLPDPALRALFAFLTADDETYRDVLEEKGLDLKDRIGFAAKFLSDKLFYQFLDKEWKEHLASGSLKGLLLTSCDEDNIKMLQSYVDRVGDVQSVSWLAMRILSSESLQVNQVSAWIESYRQLLDQWHMFAERSELDIALTNTDQARESAPQVYIACHFCGKSISSAKKGQRAGNTGSLSRQGANKNKSQQACPNCRKPLPRCAVCLVNMGTVSGSLGHPPLGDGRPRGIYKVSRFGDWFTWCQTCRHGGHADHLIDWFQEHSDCPVTGCSCKCASLDAGTISSFK